ncbi:hypothetical protein M3Y94_01203300 [Aphelenchoides besseyi]|nr:hypothetical protein M3Y94_01203300 [Aphelenchoides besseyi]
MSTPRNILCPLDQQQVNKTPRIPTKVSGAGSVAGTSSTTTSDSLSDKYVVSLKTNTSLEQYNKEEWLRQQFGINKESLIFIPSDTDTDVEIVEARTVADSTNQSSSLNEQPSTTEMRIEVSLQRKKRKFATPKRSSVDSNGTYTVERVLTSYRSGRVTRYFLKWKDYPLLDVFKTRMSVVNIIRSLCNPADIPNYPYDVRLEEERLKKFCQLAQWEDRINGVCARAGVASIYVENWIDDELAPEDFKFIQRNLIRDDVFEQFNFEPLRKGLNCNCESNCAGLQTCCYTLCNSSFAYDGQRVRYGVKPIIECTNDCDCLLSCKNGVVQRGRQIPVVLFRTKNCGWSIRTAAPIPQNTFVMQYIGEVITSANADKRMDHSFQYNMDTKQTPKFVVDAMNFGNEGRWINHSCEPNLRTLGVTASRFDDLYDELAFFAARDIKLGEELTIDYYVHVGQSTVIIDGKKCHCGSTFCRKSLLD